MTVKWLAATAAVIAVSGQFALVQTAETGFLNRSIALDGATYAYQVFVPREYRPSTEWPVILSLHGAGERGSDGLLQTEVGLGGAIRRHVERYPAIVVFPQRTAGDTWQGFGAKLALAALDASMAEFKGDPSRVYLAGLSMGGNGAWHLAFHNPEKFAALVVVCGFVTERRGGSGSGYAAIAGPSVADPFAEVAKRVATLPIWIFHGDADQAVPVEESRRMASALQAAGANVQYSELPGVGHNAWDPAYNMPELPRWLFQQRRRSP
ncbi:MAG: prolyl oligopeptidase family serine peptidase [Acidobacteriota bacterium]